MKENIKKPRLLERGGVEKDEFRRKSFLLGGGGGGKKQRSRRQSFWGCEGVGLNEKKKLSKGGAGGMVERNIEKPILLERGGDREGGILQEVPFQKGVDFEKEKSRGGGA